MVTRIGGPVIFLAIALFAWHGAWRQIRSGRTTYAGGDPRGIPRERHPVGFWLHVVLDASAGAVFAVLAILAAIGYSP